MRKIVSYARIPSDPESLVGLYRSMGIAYPKFFKMDRLSRAGFLCAEKTLSAAGLVPEDPKPDMSIVLVNSTSCTANDVEFQKGLAPEAYFPSPSLFVYTLSNIVCGEIAIRNKILGETSFFVRESLSPEFLLESVEWAFADPRIHRVLCGWVECFEGDSDCVMMLVEREGTEGEDLTTESIETIIK